ncbi:hypothetical protein B1R32_109136 [Abditibacterium utsteinense]|uniref:Uncharacterized protein n=1 Tax=Abditibacterium utsteinense TaxID=1960156 RepID=A0A2S8SSP1_9BACT|nr:hypothetical protein B1R32_109136 [Abditibacterium utsteinense]
MSKLKVKFGEPEHGWIDFSVFDGEEQIVQFEASDIYPSLESLWIPRCLRRGGKSATAQPLGNA